MLSNNFMFWSNKKIENIKRSLNIVLVAHVHSPRGKSNPYQLQCSATERFSVDEFNEIYQGIVAAGFFVKEVYFNELDFISDYIKSPSNYSNVLIYNLSRNGLKNDKKTIIPSFCELVGLKYTTSNAFTCSLCRNKYYFSVLLNSNGIPTPKSWLYDSTGHWIPSKPRKNVTLICKPNSESASQGVDKNSVIQIGENSNSQNIPKNTIVQEYINGIECEVPIFKINGKAVALSPVGIDLKGENIIDEKISESYNYEFYDLKNRQSQETITKIMNFAEKAFYALQMNVYGRIDFRVDKDGNPFVFDISTTPYTIKHSSFAFSFNKMGLKYSDIYNAIITSALLDGFND